VDYPSDRATRRGSCIFIHIWSAPDTGTSGCVGLPEARVEALQEFSRAGAVLAVLPATAFDRFASCLPAPLSSARPRESGATPLPLPSAAASARTQPHPLDPRHKRVYARLLKVTKPRQAGVWLGRGVQRARGAEALQTETNML